MKLIKQNYPFILLMVALVLLVSAGGGFNWQYCIFPLIAFIISAVLNRKSINYNTFLLTIPFMILIFASLSNTHGNYQVGLYETEKFMCFLIAFFVGSGIENDGAISKSVLFVSLFVAVCGLVAYINIYIPEAFVFYDRKMLRLQSFFTYANTTACFLGCGYFAFLKNINIENKYFQLIGALILTAFYLTFSKTAIVFFILIGTVYIILNKNIRNIFITQNIFCVMLCVPTVFIAGKHNYLFAFIFISLCIALCTLVNIKWDKLINVWIGFIGACAIGALIICLSKPDLYITFIKRLVYMKDALNLIKLNPLFGNGVGSWRAMQYSIQSSQYNVMYLHNGILQFAVENGLIFTSLFFALIAYCFILSLKNKNYYISLSIAFIILHSTFDIDLSFGAILALLGLYIGVSCRNKKDIYNKTLKNIMFIFAILIFSMINIYMISEYSVRKMFENNYVKENYIKSEAYLTHLERLCPRDSSLQITIADVKSKNGQTDVHSYLEKAVKMSPYDPEIYKQYMKCCILTDDINKMVIKLVDLAPMQEKTYSYLSEYITNAYNNNFIDNSNYNELNNLIENKRTENGVIDRNQMLDDIAKKYK